MKVWWLDYNPAYNAVKLINDDERDKFRDLVNVPRTVIEEWEAVDVIL